MLDASLFAGLRAPNEASAAALVCSLVYPWSPMSLDANLAVSLFPAAEHLKTGVLRQFSMEAPSQ